MLISAGYLLGTQWERVSDAIGPVATPLLIVLAVAGGAWLLIHGLRGRRAEREAEERPDLDSNQGPTP